MMDEQSRKTLDEILAQEPAALSDSDKGFLRARRSYLTEEQRAVYAEVLAEAPASDEATSPAEEEAVSSASSTSRSRRKTS